MHKTDSHDANARVCFNELTQVYMRSPQSSQHHPTTPQQLSSFSTASRTSHPMNQIKSSLASSDPRSPSTQFSHDPTQDITTNSQSTISRPSNRHSNHTNSTPMKQYQYLLLLQTKIYHPLWSLLHIFFEIFILTILIYTVTTVIKHETFSVDGFTIYLFVATIYQIFTIFTGVICATGAELNKQIFAAVLGLSAIIQLVTACLFLFLFQPLVQQMKATNNFSSETNTPPIIMTNSLISLYDILSSFHNLFAALHVLVFIGIIIALIHVKIQIRYMYHLPPTHPLSFKRIWYSWKFRKDSSYNENLIDATTSIPTTGLSEVTAASSAAGSSESSNKPENIDNKLILDGHAVQSPFSPPHHFQNKTSNFDSPDKKSTELGTA